MTGGSLYTGIAAGFDLAAEWAGIQVLWQVEKDKRAHKYLKKNFPGVQKFYDTKDVGKKNLTPVDIIFGGFPCQPFSKAGHRKGTADNRYQWPQFKRIVKELRPAWVVAENVDGITSIYQPVSNIQMEDQKTFTCKESAVLQTIKSDLESLCFEADVYIIPASAVGAPHRRYRCFIVAYSRRNHEQISLATGNRTSKHKELGSTGQEGGIRHVANTNGNDANGQHGSICGTPKTIENKAWQQNGQRMRPAANNGSKALSNTYDRRSKKPQAVEQIESFKNRYSPTRTDWWQFEPPVGRVADGVSGRVAQLEGLGLAVVPQVAFLFLNNIKQLHEQFTQH